MRCRRFPDASPHYIQTLPETLPKMLQLQLTINLQKVVLLCPFLFIIEFRSQTYLYIFSQQFEGPNLFDIKHRAVKCIFFYFFQLLLTFFRCRVTGPPKIFCCCFFNNRYKPPSKAMINYIERIFVKEKVDSLDVIAIYIYIY